MTKQGQVSVDRHFARIGIIAVPALILLIFVGVLYYANAPTAGATAAQRYNFLREHGASQDELCEAAQAASNAYADAQDGKNFDYWSMVAGTDCLYAKTKREMGIY